MRRTAAIIVVSMAASLAPGASQAAETHRVFMAAGNVFCVTAPACADNEDVTIKVGDTVEWVYVDPVCSALHAIGCFHTATRLGTSSQNFDSGAMPGVPPSAGAPDPTLTFAKTFTRAGSFTYVCTVHVGQFGMRATVIVSS